MNFEQVVVFIIIPIGIAIIGYLLGSAYCLQNKINKPKEKPMNEVLANLNALRDKVTAIISQLEVAEQADAPAVEATVAADVANAVTAVHTLFDSVISHL